MKKKILFLGAGAIGRGYLPWLFNREKYDFLFIDSSETIVKEMKSRRSALSLMAKNGELNELSYEIKDSFLPDEFNPSEHDDILAIFVSVGPRNCVSALKKIERIKAPVILCENEPNLVQDVKGNTEFEEVYFAVPDVITSNTSPQEYLDKNPLAIITEDGVLFSDERLKKHALDLEINYLSEQELLYKQWTAKLYVHNTPHCVAAYLGALVGDVFLHEAMGHTEIDKIVYGVMTEMLNSLKLNWDIDHKFLDWYAEKELSRFRNTLLHDPIRRVAREPLRKLEPHGRLIGAANICLSHGFIPENILLGICAALRYRMDGEEDKHLEFLINNIPSQKLLVDILGLRKGEPLEIILSSRIKQLNRKLDKLISGIQ